MNTRQLLNGALERGRLAHALLFAGPEGSGRRETARWLARRLLCSQPSPPCESCTSCQKCGRASHPDLQWLEPEGQFVKIETVRQLIRSLGFRPLESARRVAVIDQAERMNDAAANALLKTLEEPPADATLVLISSKPRALLPTIRSRTLRLDFRPPGLAEQVRQLCEQDGLDPSEARTRARLAPGQLQLARELELEPWLERRARTLELLELAASTRRRARDTGALLEASQELSRDAGDTLQLLTLLKTLLRDLAVSQLCDDAQLLEWPDLAPRLGALAERWDGATLLQTLARVEQAEEDFSHNASRRLVLDELLLGLWSSGAAQ